MFVELSFTLDDLKTCFARKKEVAAWSELKVCRFPASQFFWFLQMLVLWIEDK
jgi:hypothetical protein